MLFRVVRFLYGNLDHLRRRFLLTTAAALAYGLLRFAIPLLIAQFVDRITENQLAQLGSFIGAFVALSVLRVGIAYYLRRVGEQIGPRFANHIRNKYFQRLLDRRSLWDARFHSVHVLTLIGRVAEEGRRLLDRWIWTTTSDFIFIPAFIVYIGLRDLRVAGFVILAIAMFFIVGFVLTRPVAAIVNRLNKNTAAFTGRFGDFMANIRTVKKLHVESFATGQTTAHEASVAGDIDDLKRFHARRWGALELIYSMLFVGTVSWFLYALSQGQTTPGTIVLIVYALDRLGGLISGTVEEMTIVIEADTYLAALSPFFTPEPAVTALPYDSGNNPWSAITLQNVQFRHREDGDAFHLAVDHLVIGNGERIGVAGKSGHGKSTLFDLLARHHRPTAGELRLDGQPYEALPKSFFARHLSYMTQDAELFSMTLRDNLVLGQDIPDHELQQVIEGCGLQPLVAGLKDGLETLVGERGVRLSTGERQRVSIARGILLNRDLYLLDEITSNIDRDTERQILDFLFTTLKRKTLLFITHRLENLRGMDRIVLMDEGRIVAEGRYRELERGNELFRTLLLHPELMQATQER